MKGNEAKRGSNWHTYELLWFLFIETKGGTDKKSMLQETRHR